MNVFTGFPADGLLTEGDRVTGVRTAATGLDREGNPGSGYMPPNDITARVTVLSDGTRSALAQAFPRVAEDSLLQPADLRPRRQGAVAGRETARRGDPHAGLAASPRRLRRQLVLSDGVGPGLARPRRRARLPPALARRARPAPADEGPPALRGDPAGRRASGVGCQDHSRGRLPLGPRTASRGRNPRHRRRRGAGQRGGAEGHPLRDALRNPGRRVDMGRAEGGRHGRFRALLPTTRRCGAATSSTICGGPGTCGRPSSPASSSAEPRPG